MEDENKNWIKIFGGKVVIDISNVKDWIVYLKTEGKGETLFCILKNTGLCYKYKSVIRREDGLATYSVILPSGEEIVFGKGENGYEELEKFGYVFL